MGASIALGETKGASVAELYAIAHAVLRGERVIHELDTSIMIHSDSKEALLYIEKAQNGWMGQPELAQYIASEAGRLRADHSVKVSFLWVPGHWQSVGNQLADSLANFATTWSQNHKGNGHYLKALPLTQDSMAQFANQAARKAQITKLRGERQLEASLRDAQNLGLDESRVILAARPPGRRKRGNRRPATERSALTGPVEVVSGLSDAFAPTPVQQEEGRPLKRARRARRKRGRRSRRSGSGQHDEAGVCDNGEEDSDEDTVHTN